MTWSWQRACAFSAGQIPERCLKISAALAVADPGRVLNGAGPQPSRGLPTLLPELLVHEFRLLPSQTSLTLPAAALKPSCQRDVASAVTSPLSPRTSSPKHQFGQMAVITVLRDRNHGLCILR